MRILVAILLVVLLALQFKLWFGEGGVSDISTLRDRVETQEAENAMLQARNDELRAEVEDLQNRLEAVEERARNELGLIREGEDFYQVVPEQDSRPAQEQDDAR